MGLIKCIDCGAMVSDRAKACPHCGGPIDESVIRMARMQQQQAARPQQVQQPQRPVQQPVHQPVHQSQPIQSQQPAQPRVIVSRLAKKSIEPQQVQSEQGNIQQATTGMGGLTKKCANCHHDIDINLKFCNYCGAKQLPTAAALSATVNNAAQQQNKSATIGEKPASPSPKKPIAYPSSNNENDNQQPEEKSSRSNIFVFAGIAAVLIAGIITFFLLRGGNGNEVVDEPSPSTEQIDELNNKLEEPTLEEQKAESNSEAKKDETSAINPTRHESQKSHNHSHSSHKDKKKDKDKEEKYNYPKPATTPAAKPATPAVKPATPAAKPAMPAAKPANSNNTRQRTQKTES